MRKSRKNLPVRIEEDIKLELATLLSDIKDPKEMRDFLKSFLKENEFLGLSKRIGIIKLLSEGISYEDIQEILNVSSATISSTANFEDEKILAKIIEKIELNNWSKNISNKILNFFNLS